MFPIIGLLGERVLKTKGSFQNLAVNVCEAHTHRCSMETGLAAVGAKESKFKHVSGRRLGRISGGGYAGQHSQKQCTACTLFSRVR